MKEVNSGESVIQLFNNYLSDPAKAGSGNPAELKAILDEYPYCQLLQLFYTHNLSSACDEGYQKQLDRATLFIPRRSKIASILKIADKSESIEHQAPNSEISEETPVENSAQINEISTESADIKQQHATESDSLQAKINPSEIVALEDEKLSIIVEDDQKNEADHGWDGKNIEELAGDKQESSKKAPDLKAQNPPEIPEQNQIDVSVPQEVKTSAESDQKVSKYDDDKMPYSFLWWLNKTRKEHADTYQPYVEFKLDTSQKIKKATVDQLSSQIIENIFHLQSPLDELENAPRTVPFQVRHKEDSILEKFIKEEPQIRPPDSHKLDTENKARKSAEDPNDLVSETLAQIYTDQMLFQKAIDTYKKLSLKFPEKSTYFAVQIRELENKVN